MNTILWQGREGPGLEHLSVQAIRGGYRFNSILIARVEGRALRASYELLVDQGFVVRSLSLEVLDGRERRLKLRRTSDGVWGGGPGVEALALADCIDIDLSLSPSTNTLPIRRLDLSRGEPAEITVAYIAYPTLEVRPERQRYRLLEQGPGRSVYRFDQLSSGFTADVVVDDEGFVSDYPGLFRRV